MKKDHTLNECSSGLTEMVSLLDTATQNELHQSNQSNYNIFDSHTKRRLSIVKDLFSSNARATETSNFNKPNNLLSPYKLKA